MRRTGSVLEDRSFAAQGFMSNIKLTSSGQKSLDLSYQVEDFKNLCTRWDKYNPELNALSIVHTKKSVIFRLVKTRTKFVVVTIFLTMYLGKEKKHQYVHKRRKSEPPKYVV